MRFWKNFRRQRDDTDKITLLMGAKYQPQQFGQPVERNSTSTNRARNLEKYFRPSCLPIKNTLIASYQFFDPFYDKNYDEIKLPASIIRTPDETVLNYFSVLREASNLAMQQTGGCGTVGYANQPYPIAYNFFTTHYKNRTSYDDYLKSFEGIAHINLIKINMLPRETGGVDYFVELETIEGSSKGITYFAYYYGYVNLVKDQGLYRINDMKLYGEDFLCAAYHLWQHDAEAVVDIMYGGWCKLVKKRRPTNQEGYVKTIEFLGTEGAEYRFVFFQLTNDTDVLISQFKRAAKGEWEIVKIDPEKCLKK
ncbi:hypothetical protein [Pseudoneobacillus sp. C159]